MPDRPGAGRFEILEFVGDLVHERDVSPALLAAAARDRGARPAIVDAIRRLPRACYRSPAQLEEDLARLPCSVEPWESDR